MILGLLLFFCVVAALVYGFFALMRIICSSAEGYSSLHMGAGCMVVPFATIIGVTSMNSLYWAIEPTLHQRGLLLHEFAFSIVMVLLIVLRRYERNRRLRDIRSQY